MALPTMTTGRAAHGVALFLFALGGCAGLPLSDQGAMCAADGLAVFSDFPVAGRHDCAIAPDGSVIVSVDHEPTVLDGINPSPWFAFRIHSNRANERAVVLDYTDYKHRYSPEISIDGRDWRALSEAKVAISEDETRATLSLDLPAGDLWIAGQPLVTAREQIAWTRTQVRKAGFSEFTYGQSLLGRPLVGFLGGNPEADRMVVALTRQHPPETTGQDAFRGFVSRLTDGDDAAMRTFLSRHRILLAPMPNPDGVDGGHWRLNRGGIDLNRDWGLFTQPETRALSEWIKHEADGRQVIAFMDFHSTNRDVVYAPPLDAPSPTIDFLPFLEKQLNDQLAAPPQWSYAHNENGGTSKGWSLEALNAPGVTVELWDETPQQDARRIGEIAAEALASYFAE